MPSPAFLIFQGSTENIAAWRVSDSFTTIDSSPPLLYSLFNGALFIYAVYIEIDYLNASTILLLKALQEIQL